MEDINRWVKEFAGLVVGNNGQTPPAEPNPLVDAHDGTQPPATGGAAVTPTVVCMPNQGCAVAPAMTVTGAPGYVPDTAALAKNGQATGANDSNASMLGADGAQFASKTVWKGDGKERIDVENPNPGQRPGQIHYQDNQGNKYLYDPSTNSFPDAPNSVNKLLNDPGFSAAIEKGLTKYLGGK